MAEYESICTAGVSFAGWIWGLKGFGLDRPVDVGRVGGGMHSQGLAGDKRIRKSRSWLSITQFIRREDRSLAGDGVFRVWASSCLGPSC